LCVGWGSFRVDLFDRRLRFANVGKARRAQSCIMLLWPLAPLLGMGDSTPKAANYAAWRRRSATSGQWFRLRQKMEQSPLDLAILLALGWVRLGREFSRGGSRKGAIARRIGAFLDGGRSGSPIILFLTIRGKTITSKRATRGFFAGCILPVREACRTIVPVAVVDRAAT
jgi:hypothetical protein